MILEFKTRAQAPTTLKSLGQRARQLGHYASRWTMPGTFRAEIRVAKRRIAVVERVWDGHGLRAAFERSCIISCIRHAEELALRECYGDGIVEQAIEEAKP